MTTIIRHLLNTFFKVEAPLWAERRKAGEASSWGASSLLLSFFFLLSLTACYDDLGNYDYHELEAVAIDTAGAGIQPEYAIMRFDTLRLQPKVYFQGQEVTDGDSAGTNDPI